MGWSWIENLREPTLTLDVIETNNMAPLGAEMSPELNCGLRTEGQTVSSHLKIAVHSHFRAHHNEFRQ